MNAPEKDILIRNAEPSDAEGIVRLLNPIIETGREAIQDMPCTIKFESYYLENLRPGTIYNVAQKKNDSRIVGINICSPMLRYFSSVKHIANMSLFVDLNERRKGYGKYLADTTFEEAKNKGYEILHIYVREDNIPSLLYTTKLGFRIVGTAKEHAKCFSKYLNMIILEKIL